MKTVVGGQEDFALYTEVNRKPVQRAEDGGDMFMFPHPHQDHGSAVLHILELLKAPARDPDEECVTVIQPGGDKGVDEFLASGEEEGWAQFRNIAKTKEENFTDRSDMIVE